MNYSYSTANYLQSPPSYMYTPFGGAPFLDEYFRCRSSALAILSSAVEYLPEGMEGYVLSQCIKAARRLDLLPADAIYISCPPLAERFPPPLNVDFNQVYEHGGETLPCLVSLLLSEINGSFAQQPMKWALNALIQRFEVTRRLYGQYGPGLRAGQGEYDNLFPYAVMAALLWFVYNRTHSLKVLNTLLKLGDLLAGVANDERRLAPDWAGLAWLALNGERAAILHLAGEKGVVLDSY